MKIWQNKNKYGVAPKADRTVDGIVFDSRKEATRYGELRLLEKQGLIAFFEIQPKFDCVVNGKKVCKYTADFRYTTPSGDEVIEDVKGVKTTVYRRKKKLVRALVGIEITAM